jgi:hypothetical protein
MPAFSAQKVTIEQFEQVLTTLRSKPNAEAARANAQRGIAWRGEVSEGARLPWTSNLDIVVENLNCECMVGNLHLRLILALEFRWPLRFGGKVRVARYPTGMLALPRKRSRSRLVTDCAT